MTWTWEKYLELLQDLSHVFEQLTQVEREKTQAVCQGNLNLVDECIRKEQALSLNLRGSDQKREEALVELGIEHVKLSQLAMHAPEPLQIETRRIAEETLRQYRLLQTANKVAQDTLECNLREIEKVIAMSQQGGEPSADANEKENADTEEGNDTPHKITDFRV